MQLQQIQLKLYLKPKLKSISMYIYVCVCVYIPIYRSRHINKMLNYLDDFEGEVSASPSCVDGLPNQPVNDEDTGFGTDNSQSTTPTLPSLTSGSELFGSLFTELNRKPNEIAVVANCSFAFKQQQKGQGQEQDKEQGYQHQHHDEQHYLRRQQQSFQYHQDNSNGIKSDDEVGVGASLSGRLLKRKKLECNHVELDNDDACSEDEFIRKIATVVADNKEATRIISVQTLNNSNNKFICNTNNHEPK